MGNRWLGTRHPLLGAATALVVALIAGRCPVTTTHVRIVTIIAVGVGFAAAVSWLVRVSIARPRSRIAIGVGLLVALLWMIFAGRPPDADRLCIEYVNQLKSLEGTRYVWGGESSTGIDCSGLARTALTRAMVLRSIKEANPRLLGPTLWRFWWKDISAGDMGQGKYGFTNRCGEYEQLAGMNTQGLRPGDLAVAGGAVHVLIYLGGGEWIEANPDDRKVVINKAFKGSRRPYFNMQVMLVRWWLW